MGHRDNRLVRPRKVPVGRAASGYTLAEAADGLASDTASEPRRTGLSAVYRPCSPNREKAIDASTRAVQPNTFSLDTFSARVEPALTATSRSQLTAVLRAVSRASLPRDYSLNAVSRGLSAWIAPWRFAWRQARLPQLALPRRRDTGRSHNCDCVCSTPSVSRRHASAASRRREWCSAMLTGWRPFLNGWRIAGDAEPCELTDRPRPVEYRLTDTCALPDPSDSSLAPRLQNPRPGVGHHA